MSKISRTDFPTVNDMRFWDVKHNPKSMAKPVTIELREFISESAKEKDFRGHSRLLGFITTTAEREVFKKAAFTLFDRVNDIDDVVGTY